MDVAGASTDGALLEAAGTMRETNLVSNVQVRPTEFSELVKQCTARFVGREWLVQQVDEGLCRGYLRASSMVQSMFQGRLS